MDKKQAYLRSILSERQFELLNSGVITIHVDFFSSGHQLYARPVNSHPKLGLSPSLQYDLHALEGLLGNLQIKRNVYEDMVKVHKTGPRPSQIDKSKFKLKSENGLVREIALNGVSNKLPDKSLTYKELAMLNSDQLFARMIHVVGQLGQDKLVSRIETDPNLFGSLGSGLRSWWARADELSKFKLLSNAKQAGKAPDDHRVFIKTLGRLKGAQCPFRDFDHDLEEDTEDEDDGGAALQDWFKELVEESLSN
jgi:hypothetical protein